MKYIVRESNWVRARGREKLRIGQNKGAKRSKGQNQSVKEVSSSSSKSEVTCLTLASSCKAPSIEADWVSSSLLADSPPKPQKWLGSESLASCCSVSITAFCLFAISDSADRSGLKMVERLPCVEKWMHNVVMQDNNFSRALHFFVISKHAKHTSIYSPHEGPWCQLEQQEQYSVRDSTALRFSCSCVSEFSLCVRLCPCEARLSTVAQPFSAPWDRCQSGKSKQIVTGAAQRRTDLERRHVRGSETALYRSESGIGGITGRRLSTFNCRHS